MRQHTSVGVLLAAGSGKRFDPSGVRNKLTQQLANGTPVAVQAARNLRQVLSRVIVVVQSLEWTEQCNFPACRFLMFPHAEQGMGASLAFAIADIVAHESDADSVLIALADMPYIQVGTIQKVAGALQAGADIVQPVFQRQAGHPVGFSKRYFPALMALSGDKGARQLLLKFPVTQLEVQDPGIVQDIDYAADLQSAKIR